MKKEFVIMVATTHRRLLIAGNWKMVKTRAEAVNFANTLAPFLLPLASEQGLPQLMLCPNFLALQPLQQVLNDLTLPITVVAQTMESRPEGAFTGEVSPVMLIEAGISTVLLGHSERRQYYNETDDTVAAKTKAALAHGLSPIICVGETLTQREAGKTDVVITQQVTTALQDLNADQLSPIVLAYEPVWAIGTGKVCEAIEADRVCGVIRALMLQLFGLSVAEQTRILYGGSMNPDNAIGLLALPNIDGGLIGGASLKPESYLALVKAAITISALPVAI
jgi:triosephosphate isomerase (TIM)